MAQAHERLAWTPVALLQAAVTSAAGALLPIALVVVLVTLPASLWPLVHGAPGERVVLAGLLYVVSQALRGLRLAYILTDVRVSVRRLMDVHFLTEAVSLVLPFKTGDIYRIFEVGVVTGHYSRALIAIWIERVVDSLMIGIIIIVAMSFGPSGYEAVLPLVALLAVFIVLSLIVFLVVPQNISRLKHFVIRRYHSMAAVSFLRCIDFVQKTLSQAPLLLEQKYVTLLFVTACIWLTETLVLVAIFPSLLESPALLATSLGSFLAKIAAGSIALGPLPVEAFQHIVTTGKLSGEAGAGMYRLATAVPLLGVGLVAFVRYGTYRVRLARQTAGPGRIALSRRWP